MGKNKMRHEKNVAVLVYMGIIGLLILFFFCCYLAYIMLDYQNVNGVEKLGMMDFLGICNMLTAPQGSVPLTISTILTVLKMQITKLWWVYAVAALAVFLGATSNPKDDYRGMEQGSARWADKYDAKLFRDNTGIPMANNFYATIENPNHKSYAPNNLNETVIGGSGAGKSFRKIIPDIMQMYGSYVVTDPKGELYRNTAKFLTEAGYKIRVLNLQDIKYSNAYNPFAYMVDEQDCISVANLFMANSAGDGEKPDFWAAAAEDLLVAIPEAFTPDAAGWDNEYMTLLEILSKDEYRAAEKTITDAFYTSPVVSGAIYDALENMGFRGGRVLEPSMGIGNFFGTMPETMRNNSQLVGVEIDSITGRIAQQLYQNAEIQISGIEKTKFANGSFDVAVGNVPFGDFKVSDRGYNKYKFLIHDYFFAKALDNKRAIYG